MTLPIYSAPDLLSLPIHGVPSYIGAGVLPKQGVLLLAGQKKVGKSFIALNVAYCLANGLPLFGMQWKKKTVSAGGEEEERVVTPLIVYEPLKVLYIEQEVGLEGAKDRLLRLHSCLGAAHLQNLTVGSKIREIGLHPDTRYKVLRDVLREWRPQVFIGDPLRRFHREDENDNTAMWRVMESVEALTEEFKMAVILTHHFGHPNELSGRRGVDRTRGASTLLDAPDTLVAVESLGHRIRKLTWETRQGRPPWEDHEAELPKNLLEIDFDNALVKQKP